MCEESVDEVGSVLDALEPVFYDDGQVIDAVGGEVAQPVLQVAHAPSAGLSSMPRSLV